MCTRWDGSPQLTTGCPQVVCRASTRCGGGGGSEGFVHRLTALVDGDIVAPTAGVDCAALDKERAEAEAAAMAAAAEADAAAAAEDAESADLLAEMRAEAAAEEEVGVAPPPAAPGDAPRWSKVHSLDLLVPHAAKQNPYRTRGLRSLAYASKSGHERYDNP